MNKRDIGYAEKSGAYFTSERAEMLAFIPADARRVLEFGCGSGSFAAALKRQRRVHVTGIEPFPQAAREAASRVDRLLEADAESALSRLDAASFDCVVFNDVLEHLADPWLMLSEVKRLLAPRGAVVASIPNVRYLPVLRDLVLKGEWAYREDGVMDRTHLRFFTTKSIRDMFATCGYGIETISGINRHRSWKLDLLNVLSLGSFRDARYMQIAVVARVASA